MLTDLLHQVSLEAPPLQDSPPALLFIEDSNKNDEPYHAHYSESYYTSTFQEARVLLKKMEILNQFPEMIVVALPPDEIELEKFRTWMRNELDVFIPLVYCHCLLETEVAKRLFESRLVDDVVNLKSHFTSLPEKGKFLKKVAEKAGHNTTFSKKPLLNSSCRFCILKRSVDVLLSLTAILLCLPVLLIIGLIVKLESKGPVIYKSKRAGRGYKVFNFYKFRTMVVDADKKLAELAERNQYETGNGPSFFKIKDDPRITRFGKFLRNSSLDELPQLFNVLKGDMSIVGNRPLPLYEANSLTTNEWAERFMAPAGITGLWQISKRGREEMSSEERISLDISYARNRSLKGDFKIMLKTPSVLLQKTNV
jgi:lipopolysaccharide/colanic/teichoic acid biosynthesis glycosyltransferase